MQALLENSAPEEELAPQVGLEPTTLRLTAECSAIELLRSVPGTVQFLWSLNDSKWKRGQSKVQLKGSDSRLTGQPGDRKPVRLELKAYPYSPRRDIRPPS